MSVTVNPFLRGRERVGKTKSRIAREVGVTPRVVWYWEHDCATPRTKLIDLLMSAYGVKRETVTAWLSEQSSRVTQKRAEKVIAS